MRRATFRIGRVSRLLVISIHALHEESDVSVSSRLFCHSSFQSTLSMRRATPPIRSDTSPRKFQSTLSMRRATVTVNTAYNSLLISIHALHEESDHFNGSRFMGPYGFQSTLSMRRATSVPDDPKTTFGISIHALHEESDETEKGRPTDVRDFNPRSP